MEKLTIDPDFSQCLPGPSAEEVKELRESLKHDGCLDTIKVWNCDGADLILDGHRRYKLCQKLDLPYRVERIELPDRVAAFEWIFQFQSGRRNIPEAKLKRLRGKWYNEAKKQRGGDNRPTGKIPPNGPIAHSEHLKSQPQGTAEVIAKQTKKSAATIRREGKRETVLSKCSPAFVKAVDSGKAKVTDREIGELARLKPQQRAQAEQAIIKGKSPAHALGPHRPPVKALKGAEKEAYDARQQIKIWHETIGRWLGKPPTIDNYRGDWPSPKGDRVVKLAVEFYEALKVWEKDIK